LDEASVFEDSISLKKYTSIAGKLGSEPKLVQVVVKKLTEFIIEDKRIQNNYLLFLV